MQSDFGFWYSKEQRSVDKIRLNSRVCSCSWTNDGQCVAPPRAKQRPRQ